MKITNVRRISQCFFFFLFVWFCVVLTLGTQWRQLRGWPVNFFLNLDVLTGIGTILTTGNWYSGLVWGAVTAISTIFLGRIFCGWVCPFGAIHQAIGFIGKLNKPASRIIEINRYHPLQKIKYWILTGVLAPLVLFRLFGNYDLMSLQIGLLDPIPLLHRSFSLFLLPAINRIVPVTDLTPRYYDQVFSVGVVFMIAVLMNLMIPRFFCRFICPLGALLGFLSRFSVWRIVNFGHSEGVKKCTRCHICEKDCEGACEPSEKTRISDCVMCLNCLHTCRHDLITYTASGTDHLVISAPDVSKREFIVSMVSGAAMMPLMRISGTTASNWNPLLIRPPGAWSEHQFLSLCIKCGQCMKICPTNVIHPAGIEFGIESLWTPALNFRIGASGCQKTCIACGSVCPTSAIRPLTIDERTGSNSWQEKGPIRIGLAFVDHGRCLPWSMERPCIVCQENCPVSPKAIKIHEYYSQVQFPEILSVTHSDRTTVTFQNRLFKVDQFATGDYFCAVQGVSDANPRRIERNSTNSLTVSSASTWDFPPKIGAKIEIKIKLQRPYVDPDRCIGCGVCEHECPVRGKPAIRVTAENESRNRNHALMLAK